jgi:methyl acetate hydrolase
MTKALTSTAAMRLVERDKLVLDTPIADVLPELASAKVLEGFDETGNPKLRPAKRPITLRQLLTHTAGFGYDIWNANPLRYQKKTGVPSMTTCENLVLTTPLGFDTGVQSEYGSTSTG